MWCHALPLTLSVKGNLYSPELSVDSIVYGLGQKIRSENGLKVISHG